MMLRSLPLLLALSSFASDVKPYGLIRLGIMRPDVSFELEGAMSGLSMKSGSTDPVNNFTGSFGAGIRNEIAPNLDFDASAALTLATIGFESKVDVTGTYSGYTIAAKEKLEFEISTKFLDLDAGVLYKVSPALSLGGGAVLSIPFGAEITTSGGVTEGTMCSSNGICQDMPTNTSSGRSDTFDDGEAFMSVKAQGEYALNDRVGLQALFLYPLGNYTESTSEQDSEMAGKMEVAVMRALVGLSFRF